MKIMKLSGKVGHGKTTMLSAIKRDFVARSFAVLDLGHSRSMRDPISYLTDCINQQNLDDGKSFLVLLDEPAPGVIQWLHTAAAEWLPDRCTLIYTSET